MPGNYGQSGTFEHSIKLSPARNLSIVGLPWGQVYGFFAYRIWCIRRWHCSRVQNGTSLDCTPACNDAGNSFPVFTERTGSSLTRSLTISSIIVKSSSFPRTTGIARTRKVSLPNSSRTNPSRASAGKSSRRIAVSCRVRCRITGTISSCER